MDRFAKLEKFVAELECLSFGFLPWAPFIAWERVCRKQASYFERR
jgi:hypothetical protein